MKKHVVLSFVATGILIFSIPVTGNSQDWQLVGNSITAGQFLGTTNNENLSIRAGGSQLLLLNTNRNVGVGVGANNPEKQLHVLTFHGIAAGSHEGIRIEDRVTDIGTTISKWDLIPEVDELNGNIVRFDIGTPDNPLFSIRDNGDVGIGNTLPQSRLDIAGDILISGSRLHVNSAGNVGIGVTNLVNSLEIAGTAVIGSNLAGNGVLAPPNGLRVEGTTVIGQSGDNAAVRLQLLGALELGGDRTYIKGHNGGNNHWFVNPGSPLIPGLYMAFNENPITHIANWVNIAPGGGVGLVVDNNKRVAMGSTVPDPNYRLSVFGSAKFTTDLRVNGNAQIDDELTVCTIIKTREVLVELSVCDFVFDEDYERPSPAEKLAYYKKYKHLRGVDGEDVVNESGFKVSKNLSGIIMNVEENGLDIIDLYQMMEEKDKKIQLLEKRIEALARKIGG